MKIPKRFKLLGQVIEVTQRESDFAENTDRVAFASYRMNEIQLNPFMLAHKTKEQTEHAFLHELVHFVFWYSGPSLNKKLEYVHADENFVDLTANLLHQALTTMEYE